MLVINVKSFLCSVFTFTQIFQIVLTLKLDQVPPRCKGNECVDTDYDAEDSVRDALLNVIPDPGLQFGQPKKIEMLKRDKNVLRENWVKHLKSKNDVPPGDDIMKLQTDFLPLCMSSRFANSLDLCSSVPEKKHACINTKDGRLDECINIKNKELALALCKEKFSSKVISCSSFNKTFMCSQNISLYIEPIRTCREKDHYICLSESGELKSCEKNAISNIKIASATYMNKNEEWENFWKEWVWNVPEVGKRNPDEKLPRHLCKPRLLNDIFVDCQFHQSQTKVCIGITSRNFSECKIFNNGSTEVSIPVCAERSTNKVFTCGDFPAAFLCFPSDNERWPILPCRDEERQLCLSFHRSLEKCKELDSETYKTITTTQSVAALLHYETATEHLKSPANGIERLCLLKRDKKLERCSAASFTSLACLNQISGNIQSCHSLPKYTKTRIPICMQNQDSRIITCEKHTELCFQTEKQNTTISPCKVTSRMICLSKEGTLMSCKDSVYKELQDVDSGKKLFYFSNNDVVRRLCQKDDKSYVDCADDEKFRLVCFEERKGNIRPCQDEVPGDKSFSVCYVEVSKEIHKCGTPKKYICLAENSTNKYTYCEEKERYLCFKDGAIINCKCMQLSSRIRYLSAVIPDYKNIDRVYRAENEFIKDVLGSSQRLCQTDCIKGKFQPCSHDTDVNFACLEIKNGQLKTCAEFQTNQLIIPICRELSGEVVVCGKFFKANLCYSNDTKSFPTSTCKNTERFACLTNDGIFKLCSNTKQISDEDDELETDSGEIKDQKDVNKKEVDNDKDEQRNHAKSTECGNKRETIKHSKLKNTEEEEEEENALMHYNQIRKEEECFIAIIHMTSQHLCMTNKRNDKLMNCDEVESNNFACIAAKKGNIKACRYFKETEVALAICSQANNNVLVTCDIVSNAKLCFGKRKKNSQLLVPCEDESRYACLGKNGIPTECSPQKNKHVQLSKRIARQGGKNPTDEKFIRLHCTNCSIESKFVIEGTPDDIHPEIELFTLSK